MTNPNDDELPKVEDSPVIPATVLPTSLNGSQQLVEQVCSALDAAHKLGIADIDDMIVRLGNLKASIAEAMKDFIGSIGQSLATLQDLEKLIVGIEEKHL
jgi:hypothetical protein